MFPWVNVDESIRLSKKTICTYEWEFLHEVPQSAHHGWLELHPCRYGSGRLAAHLRASAVRPLGDGLEVLISMTSNHGNPKPSFLGVISPIYWGLKTFIFHGFGVQGNSLEDHWVC